MSINKVKKQNDMNSIMKTTNHSYGIAAILTAILLSLSLDVWGTDYVFSYTSGGTTHYLGVNNSGAIADLTAMSENCIWHCSSNTDSNPTAASLDKNTSRFLYVSIGNTKYWLVGSTTNGTVLTATTTAPGDARWRNNNSCLYYRDSNDYYVYYRGNSWRTSRQGKGDGDSNPQIRN